MTQSKCNLKPKIQNLRPLTTNKWSIFRLIDEKYSTYIAYIMKPKLRIYFNQQIIEDCKGSARKLGSRCGWWTYDQAVDIS